MKRYDREIVDPARITHIMSACFCCRLALNDQPVPYVVPLSFGFEQIGQQYVLYFHSAPQGRKIELIKAGCKAGFEMDTNHQLKASDRPCGYSSRFQSIMGVGDIVLIADAQEKAHALSRIMIHYTQENSWKFPPEALDAVIVFKLVVEELSCKGHM